MSHLPPGWTDPAQRVPRLDEHVLIQTHHGHVHAARFVVAHTEQWPDGAAWRVDGQEADLPFSAVLAWAPPGTPLPDPGATGAAPSEAPPTRRPPAIAVEVQAEIRATRPVLEALPDYALDWRPHPDLPTLLGAGRGVVALVGRIATILGETEYDATWPETATEARDRAGLLRDFDLVATTVEPLAADLDVGAVVQPWTLRSAGRLLLTLPRGDVLRRLGLSPLVHHRGQLALYLRTLGVPLAPLYGAWEAPTRDA